MIHIAVLITCFNRKPKTLQCIKNLYAQDCLDKVNLHICIVDGGSSDGTPECISSTYPEIRVEVVNGLYWAGGMRQAWANALSEREYDFLWLVNDDTNLYQNSLSVLLKTHEFSLSKYKLAGVYTGCTKSPTTGELTYGAKKLRNKDRIKGDLLAPNGDYQECDLCNGNTLLIPKEVYSTIGGLYKKSIHGIADWEYSLRAKRAGFPVLMAPVYLGECERDHGKSWLSSKSSLKERLAYMNSPKGLSYKEFTAFVKLYFPKDYYPIKIKMWIKTLFPFVYDVFKR